MKPLINILSAVLMPSVLLAEATRYVERHPLPDGRSVVVAEGDMDPRSIGSYSVRFYGGSNPNHPTDDYQGGIILDRDGTIEEVKVADIDGDKMPELVILIRCTGTGSYLSADAISADQSKPRVVTRVTDLPKNADPIAALRAKQKTEHDKSSVRGKPRR